MPTPTEVVTIKPVYYDISFKHLFGTEENIRFCKYLLKTICGYNDEYLRGLRLVNTKLSPNNINQKKYDTDVLIYLADGSIINLETYYKSSDKAYRKSQMYIYKLLLKKFHSSEDYDAIPKITQYNFIKKGKMKRYDDITLFGVKDKFNNNHAPYALFDIYEINVDDVKKNMSSKQKNLLEFINAENEEDMKKIARRDKMINEMYEELKRFCQSDEYPIPGYTKEDIIRDSGREEGIEIGLEQGREQGLEQGRQQGLEQGITQGKNETIIEMLKDNMALEQISKYTKLSIEDIRNISKGK